MFCLQVLQIFEFIEGCTDGELISIIAHLVLCHTKSHMKFIQFHASAEREARHTFKARYHHFLMAAVIVTERR